MHLGSQHGSQNLSKTNPKSNKKRWKLYNHMYQKLCMHIEWSFDGSWGQHGPKSLPKGAPKRLWFSSFVGSWKGLGASWGPRADFIYFWSIFDRFLSNFDRFFGWFFDDFSKIFLDFLRIWCILALKTEGLGGRFSMKFRFIRENVNFVKISVSPTENTIFKSRSVQNPIKKS